MTLDVLPTRSDSAAANMATDVLLLQRYPADTHARFRHYGWHRPAVTFGFSQKIGWVREHLRELPGSSSDAEGWDRLDLCRRPTGGGMVDHRDDWTYALVLPRGHRLADARAVDAYQVLHAALADALCELGVDATLKRTCEPDSTGNCGPGVCFQRPELYDVVHARTQGKIAGAALKRNKRGLLFQGSLWRPAAGALDWEAFASTFVARLAPALAGEATVCGWPEFSEEEVMALTEQYASPEWIEQR